MVEKQKVTELLAHALIEWESTPGLRIEDAYKWLYQATMGAEHAILDLDFVREWLERDWSQSQPNSDEPIFSPLRPDMPLCRINLRAAKAAGIKQGHILRAFLDTSKLFPEDEVALQREWLGFKARLVEDRLPTITIMDWRRLTLTKGEGFPPLSHSKPYKQLYAPCYRVILSDLL